jgi:hypothetical protein
MQGLTRWLTGALCGMALATGVRADAVPEKLSLAPGHKQVVRFDTDVRAATADSTHVQLQGIGERNLEIEAKSAGRAVVSYELRSGRRGQIEVTVGHLDDAELGGIKEFLDRQMQDVVGVETLVNARLGVVEINGSVKLSRDRDRLEQVVKTATTRWRDKILNNVVVAIDMEPLRVALLSALEAAGIENAAVRLGPDQRQAVLEGTAFTQDGRKEAARSVENTVKRLRIDGLTTVNNIKVTDALIETEFIYFYFSDNLQRDLGMDLLNNIGLRGSGGGGWATDSGGPRYQATVDVDIGKIFNLLASDGHVAASKALAVRAQNGQTGSGSFGDKIIIIPRATGAGTQADYKEINAGFRVNVTPTFIGRDAVRLNLEMAIDAFGGYTGQGDATVRENQVTTVVDVPLNHYAIIAVNESREHGEGKTGTPILRHIPILNLVFGRPSKVVATTYTGVAVVPRSTGTVKRQADSIAANTEAMVEKIEARLKKK